MVVRSSIVRLVILSAVLLGSAAYVAKASVTEPVPIRESLATFPMLVGGWTGSRAPDFPDDILKVLGVDEYLNRTYRTGTTGLAGLYIGYYQSQRQGDAIHSPLNCLPGAGWEPVSRSYLPLQVQTESSLTGAGTTTIEINRYLIRKGLDTQVVLYWYQSQGRVVANEYWSKAYMVFDAIRSNRTDAALVRVVAPVLGADRAAEETAERHATEFVRSIYPLLGRYLPS